MSLNRIDPPRVEMEDFKLNAGVPTLDVQCALMAVLNLIPVLLWRDLQAEEQRIPVLHVPILRIHHARICGREWRALVCPGAHVAGNLQLVIRGEG